MGVILDTSVLIAAERGELDLAVLLRRLGDEPVAIAAITAAELLHGCHRARDPGTAARRSAFVEGLLTLVPVLPFGLPEARRHAELWAALAAKGGGIGAHDMLVGATVLAQAATLATLNRREFERIPGIRLVAEERFTG